MSQLTLSEISDKMRDIDFAMLSTRTEGGAIAARPMSNNGDVAYEGDSWFFSDGHTRTVADIERDPTVGLSFTGSKGLLGSPPIFIAIEGVAELIRDKATFERALDEGSRDLVRGRRRHPRARSHQGPCAAHPLLERPGRG